MAVTHPRSSGAGAGAGAGVGARARRHVPSDRRQRSALRSAAASGLGPTGEKLPGGRWPGAVQKFALFGEVLETGIIVTIVALPIVTLPLALAVGHRHLDRFLRAESTGLGLVWRDIRAGLIGALGVGAAFLAMVLLLLLDLQLAFSGALPGGEPVGVVGAVALAAAAVLLVRSAAAWSPGAGRAAAGRFAAGHSGADRTAADRTAAVVPQPPVAGWRAALRAGAFATRTDLVGSIYLLVAVALTVLATWMLPPLLVPALGCLAFASVAISARASARAAATPTS